ncbi:tryptophan 2,3-dioxygenase [Nocardia arthritidis]|uniref:Tryptophan 2,3-dioxygenase n=1 Tax=Nocardia arthritidis TaxID=228602 RepID=A0A6G9YCN8_9NOCA|nr:tryptophan 2,3-dioxygenase family protein [Nocardia arthritidis]QIS11045.1 tryptophan 2,3-dioxygenase [Nocardia arthritidis]
MSTTEFGCPYGTAPYVSYSQLDALHEMQHPTTDSPLEMQFILITQVKELLFRMAYVDLDEARNRLRANDCAQACRALARVSRVQRVLQSSWDYLNGMSASEFLGFRHVLGSASGNQSFMYRALEFILGNKDDESLAYIRQFGPLAPILAREVAEPSLDDEVIAYLGRTFGALPTPSRPALEPAVEEVWLAVYRDPNRYPEQYALAEALLEVAYQFAHWRSTHLLVVERMLGAKPGTGGTAGLDWLRRIRDHRFFPELWAVRTRM